MKSIIIFSLFTITIINSIGDAHENHDHQIYNWSNSKDKTIKSESAFNIEELEDKKNKPKTNTKDGWIKLFRR